MQQDTSVLGRYGYDSEGMRILKIGDDGVRRYTYDQLSVITEANQANTTVSKYDYGLDQLVSLDNSAEGRSFYHLDFLGSTVNLTGAFGATRQSILYDAWGNERDRVGLSENNFTFTGHEKDEETGLVYAKARFYDPDIGRFLTQDSFLGDATNVPSLHRYTYGFSNPLTYVDPTGHENEKMTPTAAAGMTTVVKGEQGKTLVLGAYEASVTVNCNQYGCTSSEEVDHEINGVVRESMAGDEQFRERMVKVVGQVFGGHIAETPDWQKNWYVNFATTFADEFAMTVSEPALRTQYGILHDDAKQIAIGVVEQIGAAVVGRGLAAAGERAAAAAIARYPWLAKPVTEAFRDASKGLKGQLQKQAQRVVKYLEEYVARRSGRLGSPSQATSGSASSATTTNPVASGGGTTSSSASLADDIAEGSFSITEQGFRGYPEGVPRPKGPFRLVDGDEYAAARAAANKENAAIRARQNLRAKPVEVHEIKPVKFGGSPTDPNNKVILDRTIHRQQVTPWWNKLLKDLANGPGGGGG